MKNITLFDTFEDDLFHTTNEELDYYFSAFAEIKKKNEMTSFNEILNWERTIQVELELGHQIEKNLVLMGEEFIRGCTSPLYDLFWFLTSFFKIWKRFFASVIKIISGIYG